MVTFEPTVSGLILLLTTALAFAEEPGVKFEVTAKGLDYVNHVARAELRSKLQTLTIPNQSGSEGSRSWSLTNIRIHGISGPDTHISLNPGEGGVTMGLLNFGINLSADWSAQYRIIWRFTSSGSVDLNVAGASVTVVSGFREKNGRPSVFAKSCRCQINDIGINFHGGFAAFILNLFKGIVRSKIRNLLQDKVCEIVQSQINTRADDELAKMRVNVEVARNFILDYSLVGPAIITRNYIQVASRGAVYWRDNRARSPFTPAALPPLSYFNNMLYLSITESSANTFAYVAHVNGYLKYNLTVANLPNDSSDLLTPTGQLKSQYPDTKLELRISSSSAPSVQFGKQKLTITAAANVQILDHAPNGVVPLLVIEVTVSCTAKVSVENGKLTGLIDGYTFNIVVKESAIGPINADELKSLIQKVIDKVVIPRLNVLGKQGIDLPVTRILRLYNTGIDVQDGALQVSTDVEYLK